MKNKNLIPDRYSLKLGKAYHFKKADTKQEIIFKVLGDNQQYYTCLVWACTRTLLPHPDRVSITYHELGVKNWEFARSFKLAKKDLPLYVTWEYCCKDFIDNLQGHQ
jgi:hypothetical protein